MKPKKKPARFVAERKTPSKREESRANWYRRQFRMTVDEQSKLIGRLLRKLKRKVPLKIPVRAFISEPTVATGQTGFDGKRLEIIVACGLDFEATTSIVAHEYAHCVNFAEGKPNAGHGKEWGDAYSRVWLAIAGADRCNEGDAFAAARVRRNP